MKVITRPWCVALCIAVAGCGGGGSGGEGGGGGVAAPPADTVPDGFTFAPQIKVPLDSLVESDPVTISGIDVPAEVSVSGGEYSVSGGAFTSAPGDVSNGQTIVVRLTSPATENTNASATLTVGGVAAVFRVRTVGDDVAPTVTIVFPPPSSMSDGSSILVRGTASDAESEIVSLSVNGVDADSTDGFLTWTASVPLEDGVNELAVSVTDESLNADDAAAALTILRTEPMLPRPGGIDIDRAGNRALIADPGLDSVVAVDLTTGARSILSGPGTAPDPGNPVVHFSNSDRIAVARARGQAVVTDFFDFGLVDLTTGARSAPVTFSATQLVATAIDSDGDRALLLDRQGSIYAYQLDGSSVDLFSSPVNPGPDLTFPLDIDVDEANGRALVVEQVGAAVFAVDLITGDTSIFSDDSTPNAGNDFVNPVLIAVDDANQRALVVDGSALHPIYAVSLSDGARTVLWNDDVPDAGLPLSRPAGIVIDGSRALISDDGEVEDRVVAIDLMTGSRTLLTEDRNHTPSSQLSFLTPRGIALDTDNGRALVVDAINSQNARVKAVDLETGARSIVSGPGVPDDVNGFGLPEDIVFDASNGRALVSQLAALYSGDLVAVDLATGARTIFASGFSFPRGLAIDVARNRVLVADYIEPALVGVSLADGTTSIISGASSPGEAFSAPLGVAVAGDRILVSDPEAGTLFEVDPATGARTRLLTTGSEDTEIIGPAALLYDAALNRLLVTDIERDAVIGIDLATGARSMISSGSMPNVNNPFGYPAGIVLDTVPGRALIAERGILGVVSLDLATGERVYLSR